MAMKVSGDELGQLNIEYTDPLFLGDVMQIDFEVLDGNDNPIDLTNSRWVFGLGTIRGTVALIKKDTNISGEFDLDTGKRKAMLRVTKPDTVDLDPGDYLFDVQYVTAGGDPLPFATGKVTFIKPFGEV